MSTLNRVLCGGPGTRAPGVEVHGQIDRVVIRQRVGTVAEQVPRSDASDRSRSLAECTG